MKTKRNIPQETAPANEKGTYAQMRNRRKKLGTQECPISGNACFREGNRSSSLALAHTLIARTFCSTSARQTGHCSNWSAHVIQQQWWPHGTSVQSTRFSKHTLSWRREGWTKTNKDVSGVVSDQGVRAGKTRKQEQGGDAGGGGAATELSAEHLPIRRDPV